MIKEYDKIRLKTDEVARIVEVFDDYNFLAEIFRKTGGMDTTEIKADDIKSVFVENEYPIEDSIGITKARTFGQAVSNKK